jgi:hypothetical protein
MENVGKEQPYLCRWPPQITIESLFDKDNSTYEVILVNYK